VAILVLKCTVVELGNWTNRETDGQTDRQTDGRITVSLNAPYRGRGHTRWTDITLFSHADRTATDVSVKGIRLMVEREELRLSDLRSRLTSIADATV